MGGAVRGELLILVAIDASVFLVVITVECGKSAQGYRLLCARQPLTVRREKALIISKQTR